MLLESVKEPGCFNRVACLNFLDISGLSSGAMSTIADPPIFCLVFNLSRIAVKLYVLIEGNGKI